MTKSGWTCVFVLALASGAGSASAEIISVAAGGDLQAALNRAQPGDTILLAEGGEFVGNFVLPVKSGDNWITVRSSAPDTLLPPDGHRIRPAHAPLLARIRSPNTMYAMRTAAGAHHWRLQYLEFAANQNGFGDILQLGDGSSAQNSLSLVPHHLVLSHVYIHGDPALGQKRCVALNAAHVTIKDSHVAECKTVGQDTQAIGGWNGPGPYVIENNYLEAAGENVMFGGADPSIANLVPDGITLRRNYLSRPMSWKNPIFGTPQGVSATAEGGGALPAGVYAYRVVARGPIGQGQTGRSTASAQVSATVGAGGAVRIRWQPVANATEYRVYGRTAGGQNQYWRVTAPEFVDGGAAGAAENVPTSEGTRWTVKNVFELKNARNVVLEENIFENHWPQAQSGWSIVLTPRNSNGSCTWCVVEHVRFEWNLVRNVSAGVNLTGYDDASRPTRQTNDIVFRNNLFAGIRTSLGANAWFLLIGDSPRNVTVEHNTIDANGSSVVYTHGGSSTDPREIYGFRMVANAARHGSYGFAGAFYSFGNAILTNFYPDGVFTANYLAGGPASSYPAGNLFSGVFTDQFVDANAGDFTLRSTSFLRGAAPDGSDIGVDYGALAARIAGVAEGVPSSGGGSEVPPRAEFSWSCTYLDCTFADESVAGTSQITARAWAFGDGGQATTAAPTHRFANPGTYDVTLSVTDAAGRTATAAHAVRVDGPQAPIAQMSLTCSGLSCAYADTSTAGSGSIASRTWNFGDGTGSTLPSGSHTYATDGTYTVSLTVVNSYGISSSVSRTVTVAPDDLIVPGGPPVVVTVESAGQNVELRFNGTAGRRVSLGITDVTIGTSACCSARVSIVNPDGSLLVVPTYFGTAGKFIDVQTLGATGVYRIVIEPQSTSTGSATLTLYDVPADARGTIVPGGPAVTVATTVPGQDGELTFTGSAGQTVSLEITDNTYSNATVAIQAPDGSVVAARAVVNGASAFIDATPLPASGTYTLAVRPNGLATGSMALRLHTVVDATGTAVVNGSPVTVNLTTPGQNGRISFAGTAGGRITLQASAVTIPTSVLSIVSPDGSALASRSVGTSGAVIDAVTLPATGTYVIVVDPLGAYTGSLTLTLSGGGDVVGTIVPGGPAVTVTIATAGQAARLTFNGTAGRQVSLTLTNVTIGTSTCCSTRVSILRPDGTALGPTILMGTNGGFIDTRLLDVSGTYTIVVDPEGTNTGSARLQLFDVPPDAAGSIVPGGAAATVSLTTPGQNAELVFQGTAGRRVSAVATNVSVQAGTLSIVAPDGTAVASAYLSRSGSFIDVRTLEVSGTYTVRVDPQAANTGSASIVLYDVPPDAAATVAVNGASANLAVTTPGQNASVSFTGAAGQTVTVRVLENTTGYVTVRLIGPDGTTLRTMASTARTFNVVQALGASGVYRVTFDPRLTNVGALRVAVTTP